MDWLILCSGRLSLPVLHQLAWLFLRSPASDLHDEIVRLRKLNLSVPAIKARLDASSSHPPSERAIRDLLLAEGFARLPRRSRAQRAAAGPAPERAPASVPLLPHSAALFQSERAAGILCFLPLLRRYRIDEAIRLAGYPGTSTLSPLQSVLAFLALKLSNIRRYSADDIWCMDRGPGLFAGLNVLPKAAWFSSYSDRTTRAMNQRLLAQLARILSARALVSDAANLDCTTLPHWGDDQTLEKHWAGSRGRALTGFSAALAQVYRPCLFQREMSTLFRQQLDRVSHFNTLLPEGNCAHGCLEASLDVGLTGSQSEQTFSD